MIAAVARFPECVSREEKDLRINWRKDNRLRAQHPKILGLHRHRQNALRLAGSSIEPRQFTADDDIRIERIGDDITVFLRRNRLPIPKRDLSIVTATCDSG